MKTHTLIQGSAEWHAYRTEHFNASDAPAMMGCSAFKTRTQLLHEMHTGLTPEVDAATQRRFDDGHRFEALARPLAEEIIGEELYPVTGSDGKLSASFDGLTMAEDIAFEHKTLNSELRACITADGYGAHLPKQYGVQMEQQCMVSGASKVLFMASKWDGDELVEERHCWYEADAELRADIVAGWSQFAADLAAFVPVEVLPAAVATPTMNLPAVSVQMRGEIAVISNLDLFGRMLTEFVAGLDTNPSDDLAFANTEQAIKTLSKAQEALEAAEAGALAQTASIEEMRRTVGLYVETARTTRLMLEKLVKARKEQIRVEWVQAGAKSFAAHIAGLNASLGKPFMPAVLTDFPGVIRGKKTVSSIKDAIGTELARAKIEASGISSRIQSNLTTLREFGKDHAFLFADTGSIVLKAPDDLTMLVKSRIADHQAAEEKRLTAQREQIRAEEQAKAEKEARENVAREAAAAIEAKAIADCAAADARIAAGLHANGAPMFSTTTFKDNGEPIMLDDQGKRSVFCDIADDAAKLAANVVQVTTPQESAARILAARLPEAQKTPPAAIPVRTQLNAELDRLSASDLGRVLSFVQSRFVLAAA